MHLATRFLFAGAFVLGGCGNRGEFTTISFGAGIPAQVNTSCGVTCAIPVQADLSLEDSESLPVDASVEIKQYRIDYELAGSTEEMPFFADEINLVVAKGDSASFLFYPAGEAQRSWAIDRFAGQDLSGQALLTMAGYDDLNDSVEISARFSIGFGDYGVGDSTPPPEDEDQGD